MAQAKKKPTYRDTIGAALAAYEAGDISVLGHETVKELARLAFSRISDFGEFGPDGFTLKDSSILTADEIAAIGEIQTRFTKTGAPVVEVKLWPKPKALELLLRVCGMLVDKHEVTQVGPIELDWAPPTGGDDAR